MLLLPLLLRPSACAQPVPRPDHVVVVMMENRRYDEIIGNTTDAPWINSLRPIAANFTDSRGIQHPSQPNYLHLFSGSNQGKEDNSRVTPPSPPFRPLTTPNLGAQLFEAGYTFVDYGEDMPFVGFDGDSFNGPNGTYFRCENVAANWMTDANPRPPNTLPLLVMQPLPNLPGDYAQLPDVSFWHAVEEFDMHAGFYPTSADTIHAGDNWLRRNLSNYVAWAMIHQSLFVLTWDEDDYTQPSNRIPTLFVGPMVRPGNYSTPINHHTVLRTLEDMFSLPYAGNAATSAPIIGIWRSTLTDRLVVYLAFDTNLDAQASTTRAGTVFAGTPRYTSGILGGAASFRNRAEAGPPTDWAVSLGDLEATFRGDFSASLWVRTTNTDAGALFGNTDWSSSSNVGWAITTLDEANVHWTALNNAPRDVDLQPPFADGNWHLVSVTFNRAANRVITYLDGYARRTNSLGTLGSASLDGRFNTLIGASGPGAFAGSADVDELAVWSRPLTSWEVQEIFIKARRGQTLAEDYVPAPVILAQPTNQLVRSGSNVTFTVRAIGLGSLRYRWRFNGADLDSATNATLTILNAQSTNVGSYTVAVSDPYGPTISAPARLDLLVDPFIIQHPLSQPVVLGGTVTLSVSVSNTATLPIGYRWRQVGPVLINTLLVLTQHTCFLTLTNVQPLYTNFSVVVTNLSNPAGFLSRPAFLTVLPDADLDGLPDSWETNYNLRADSPADRDLDPDHDGQSNWQEYIAGTDPTDPSSVLKAEILSASDGVTIRFLSRSNKTYSVQYGEHLPSGEWFKLADLPAQATNQWITIRDAPSTTSRYYRLVTPAFP